jgi:hypothetical protein
MQSPLLDWTVAGVKTAVVLLLLGCLIAALAHCGSSSEDRPSAASWSTGLGVSRNAALGRCVPDTFVGCGLGSTDQGFTCATGEAPELPSGWTPGPCGTGAFEGYMGTVEVVAYCCDSREP